jgi:hypothetical protein
LQEIGERDRRGEVDVGDARGLKSAGEVLETVCLTWPGGKVERGFSALVVKEFQSASPGLGGVILGCRRAEWAQQPVVFGRNLAWWRERGKDFFVGDLPLEDFLGDEAVCFDIGGKSSGRWVGDEGWFESGADEILDGGSPHARVCQEKVFAGDTAFGPREI